MDSSLQEKEMAEHSEEAAVFNGADEDEVIRL